MKWYTVVITCLALTVNAKAQKITKLPIFFSDSMILQRNTEVAIWGTDSASVKVVVTGSWNDRDSAITDIHGRWKVKLQTPNAGQNYSLTIKGSTTKTINNILMGEVWFCSGQSNMEMPMKGYVTATPPQIVDSADFFIANSTNTNIRVFKPGWNPVSATPVRDFTSGKWIAANPNSTPEISATAYFFARKIQEKLGVPVGIMVSARGGSKIEAWMDSTTLASVRPVVIPPTLDWQQAHQTDVQLYNTFLHPFIGYTIKGVIWSQGEANRSNNSQYKELFSKMIASWRNVWGIGNFPFYFAEVAPNGGTTDFNAVLLREAQLITMLETPNTGMASTLDIGVLGMDHYPKKKVVGDRLAEWALIKTYNFSGTPSGPIFKSLTITGSTINLRFDYSGNGLSSLGGNLANFEIAGANKIYHAATTAFANFNFSINVSSSNVPAPLYVRYGFKNFVEGSLFNLAKLPAPSFRTEQLQNVYTLLPVVFGNISVAKKSNHHTIAFNTLEEINVTKFDVLQSLNQEDFKTIGTIMANGYKSNYEYTDFTNYNNTATLYYKIKVINKDGSFMYSNIVKSSPNSLKDDISIINPSTNKNIVINFKNSFTGSLIIKDCVGKQLIQTTLNNQKGIYKVELPKSAGIVFVSIINKNNQLFTKTISMY